MKVKIIDTILCSSSNNIFFQKLSMSEAKADTVPGLGFKDKDKALETLKILEGRDPDYQRLAVKGLIGRAKRTLSCKFV